MIRCKLFGHNFDARYEEVFHCAMTTVYYSNKCLKCGIDISEVYEIDNGVVKGFKK